MSVPLSALSAAGSAITALGGAIGSFMSNRETNRTNVELQESANEANYEQWLREKEFALDMWNRENEYNSPVNQAARLRAAGLNPAMIMQSAGGNVASSVNTPSSAPAQAAHIVPYDFNPAMQGVRDAFSLGANTALSQAQVRNIDAQTMGTQIDNMTRFEENQARISKLLSDKDLSRWHEKSLRQAYALNEEMRPYILGGAKYDIANKQATNRLIIEQVSSEIFNRQMADKQYSLALRRLGVDTGLAQATIRETIARAVASETNNQYLDREKMAQLYYQDLQNNLIRNGMPAKQAENKIQELRAIARSNPAWIIMDTLSDMLPFKTPWK